MALKGRTKWTIAEGLFALNRTKPLSKITVSDIVQASGINRNTFYYYFKDKNDLISWIYVNTVNAHFGGEEDTFGQDYTVKVFDIIKDHRKFYREAFLENGTASFDDFIRKYWMEVYIKALREKTGNSPSNEELFAIKSFCYSRIDHLKEWVVGDCKLETAEFSALMLKDVPPCLEGLTYQPYLMGEYADGAER